MIFRQLRMFNRMQEPQGWPSGAMFWLAAAILPTFCACLGASEPRTSPGGESPERTNGAQQQSQETSNMAFSITSPAFKDGKIIPKKFTCAGEDVSPALSWSGMPSATKAFALIADDPDAPVGTWVHWVIYDLPANLHQLAENISREDQLKSGGRQGKNDFRKIGYNGPCPPTGKLHRYFFTLYATVQPLNL